LRIAYSALFAVLAVGAVPSPLHAQSQEDVNVPVSLERIRAALEHQPTPLQLPPSSSAVPTFRVEIRERLPILQPPTVEKPIDPTYGLPTINELILDGVEKVRTYKRSRDERRARKEVEDALAAFCATNRCPTSK
jgi:hypothetical protein